MSIQEFIFCKAYKYLLFRQRVSCHNKNRMINTLTIRQNCQEKEYKT